jgi:hypothetical protein
MIIFRNSVYMAPKVKPQCSQKYIPMPLTLSPHNNKEASGKVSEKINNNNNNNATQYNNRFNNIKLLPKVDF